MIAHLLAAGPIAVAQSAPDVFPRLGDKRQHRLVAPLAFVLRVIALASAHLLAVKRVHGGVSVQGNDLQLHIGRRPDPFAQGSHQGQNLPGDIEMERIHESPERGLHRQLGDFQDARQNRITGDEAQLVQPRKADIEPQYDSQHEPVQVHDTGNALRGHRLFHQGLKVELFQHGDHRQQPAVRSQILASEVIGRGCVDFIGLRSRSFRPLWGAPGASILISLCNHLGDLRGDFPRSCPLRRNSVLPHVSGVPKWSNQIRLPSDGFDRA